MRVSFNVPANSSDPKSNERRAQVINPKMQLRRDSLGDSEVFGLEVSGRATYGGSGNVDCKAEVSFEKCELADLLDCLVEAKNITEELREQNEKKENAKKVCRLLLEYIEAGGVTASSE